ncbi:MAG: Ig-like domain-containing protein [Limisphaerales bacterium]
MKTVPALPIGPSPLLLLIALALMPGTTPARNPVRQAFFQVYPNAVGTVLDTVPSRPGHCGVCHFKFDGGGARNPYGLTVQTNLSLGNSNAVWLARNLDPDGDGVTSHAEITDLLTYANTPTFPGYTNTNGISAVNLAEISARLVPVVGGDTTPPAVTVTKPNGGEIIIANLATNLTWTATDASGVAAVHLYLSTNNGASWHPIARNLANTGTFSWVPADRPSAQARIRVVATDTYGNMNFDDSNGAFSIVSRTGLALVGTTLRDFDMPGTQPFEHGPELAPSSECATCHGGYDPAKEPHFNWQGSMMANASRDLLFQANLALANQDAANSGDLCLRCHLPRGWLGGRSVPTDGGRMVAADGDGVTCALCHGMTDPVYRAGINPTNDLAVLAALTFPGSEYGNGMYVIDPSGVRRGPYSDATMGHASLGSAFHRSAAFCGTCHDVSNPVFTKDANGVYQPNAMDAHAGVFSPHFLAPVERTYSEWLNSDYNSTNGVFAPAFAGNRPGQRVSTCQHCHMRSTSGYVADPNGNPGIPLRADMAVHDMTGGSTWMPAMLTNLFPGEVNQPAIQAGIERATYLLQNAASLAVADVGAQLKVTVTNECGHKLPTGYPEGRRVWLNVQFYDAANQLLGESGAYDPATGVLTRDAAAKIYEVHPGIDTNIAGLLGKPAAKSLHFVLNNKIYTDNRIPPRGFNNTAYAAFGGEPVGHEYADGQYWDDTLYALPPGAVRAEVRLYYQSTSKEFVEFLRTNNVTNTKGQELYDLWNNNGKCPPTLMAAQTWVTAFQMQSAAFTESGRFRIEFLCRPGLTYTIEYKDALDAPAWQTFAANGTQTPDGTSSHFEDDFTTASSGGPSPTGARFYRIRYLAP